MSEQSTADILRALANTVAERGVQEGTRIRERAADWAAWAGDMRALLAAAPVARDQDGTVTRNAPILYGTVMRVFEDNVADAEPPGDHAHVVALRLHVADWVREFRIDPRGLDLVAFADAYSASLFDLARRVDTAAADEANRVRRAALDHCACRDGDHPCPACARASIASAEGVTVPRWMLGSP